VADFTKSDLFTPSERAALAFAEGMTNTPAEVSDEDLAEAQRHFSNEQLVELAETVDVAASAVLTSVTPATAREPGEGHHPTGAGSRLEAKCGITSRATRSICLTVCAFGSSPKLK